MSRQAGMLSSVELFRFGIKTCIGIALARILTKEDFGSYRQLFLIYTTFSTLLLLGIPQSVMYFVPKASDDTQRRKIISRTLNIVSLMGLMFALALFLLRHPISILMNNPDLSSLMVLFAIYPVFMFITQIYSTIMLSLQRPQSMARFTVFAVLSDLVLILSVAVLTKNLDYIVMGVLVSAFGQWIYARIKLSGYVYRDLRVDGSVSSNHCGTDRGSPYPALKEQLRYSLPLGLASIIGLLAIQLDKFVISGFFAPEQFAVFAIGAMELPFISILTNSVNSVILPHLSARQNIPEAIEIYRASVRKNALLIFPLAAIFALFATPFIRILYTSNYIDSVPFFRVYMFTVPLRVATFGIIFLAFNRTRIILANAVFTLVLNCILNLILVRYMGMMGPALSTVLATYLSMVYYVVITKSKLGIDPVALLPLAAIARTGGAVLVAGLLCVPLLYVYMNDMLKLALGSALFGILYLIFGVLLGAILPYDRQFIVSLWKRR